MSATEPFVRALSEVRGQEALPASAMAFATAGIPVFPCAAGGKPPLIPGGFRSASTDRKQIARWWAAHPSANIGMPTGSVSGVVVVDVDVHGPVNGYEALARARRTGLLDGWMATVRTPSGGLHVYFPVKDDEQRSWQVAAAGVDFRGDGGYIIVPPSQRAVGGQNSRYEVTAINPSGDHSLDSHALRDFLAPPRPIPCFGPRSIAPGSLDVARLAGWVARRQDGERNHGLFWAACTMAEHSVSAGDALDLLTVAGTQAGLSPREVATTVRSAYRTVQAGPPGLPERCERASAPDRPPPQSQVRAQL